MNHRHSPDMTDFKNCCPRRRWHDGPPFFFALVAAAACGYALVIALMSIA